MGEEKENSVSWTTLAEDLRRLREGRRKFTPEEIRELNELLDGPVEKDQGDQDKKSARHPQSEA